MASRQSPCRNAVHSLGEGPESVLHALHRREVSNACRTSCCVRLVYPSGHLNVDVTPLLLHADSAHVAYPLRFQPALSYRTRAWINPANRRVSSLLGAAAVAKFTAFSRNIGSERLAVVRNSAVFEILASSW